jgi:hypothetical protein
MRLIILAIALSVVLIFVTFRYTQREATNFEQQWRARDYRTTPRGTAWTVIESLEFAGVVTPEQAKKSMEYLKHPKKLSFPPKGE